MKNVVLATMLTIPMIASAATVYPTVVGTAESQTVAGTKARAALTVNGCLAFKTTRDRDFIVVANSKSSVSFEGAKFTIECTDLAPVTPPTPIVYASTISWVSPTSRTDGTALKTSEIVSYSLSVDGKVVTVKAPATSYVVQGLLAGNHTAVITVTDINGLTSAASKTVVFTAP